MPWQDLTTTRNTASLFHEASSHPICFDTMPTGRTSLLKFLFSIASMLLTKSLTRAVLKSKINLASPFFLLGEYLERLTTLLKTLKQRLINHRRHRPHRHPLKYHRLHFNLFVRHFLSKPLLQTRHLILHTQRLILIWR